MDLTTYVKILEEKVVVPEEGPSQLLAMILELKACEGMLSAYEGTWQADHAQVQQVAQLEAEVKLLRDAKEGMYVYL